MFYFIRECSSRSILLRECSAEMVSKTNSLSEQIEKRTAIRHGTACKSDIPEWAGKGVGVVGIVYLVYAMPTYKTVRPGDDQNVGT